MWQSLQKCGVCAGGVHLRKETSPRVSLEGVVLSHRRGDVIYVCVGRRRRVDNSLGVSDAAKDVDRMRLRCRPNFRKYGIDGSNQSAGVEFSLIDLGNPTDEFSECIEFRMIGGKSPSNRGRAWLGCHRP
jgi:hypothetical protein